MRSINIFDILKTTRKHSNKVIISYDVSNSVIDFSLTCETESYKQLALALRSIADQIETEYGAVAEVVNILNHK